MRHAVTTAMHTMCFEFAPLSEHMQCGNRSSLPPVEAENTRAQYSVRSSISYKSLRKCKPSMHSGVRQRWAGSPPRCKKHCLDDQQNCCDCRYSNPCSQHPSYRRMAAPAMIRVSSTQPLAQRVHRVPHHHGRSRPIVTKNGARALESCTSLSRWNRHISQHGQPDSFGQLGQWPLSRPLTNHKKYNPCLVASAV